MERNDAPNTQPGRKPDPLVPRFAVNQEQLGLSAIGINLVVATALGMWIGFQIDRFLGTKPWVFLAMTIFGIVAGFVNIFRELERINRKRPPMDPPPTPTSEDSSEDDGW